ncbi:unnamed protein product [Scytosiphon promiscuus]
MAVAGGSMENGNASCERVLFAERDQVMAMLQTLASADCEAEEREGILTAVTGALEKYLEQPHLLDPHLEAMMAVVMGRAKELVANREEEVLAGSGGGSRGRPGEAFPFQVFICPQLHSMFCVVYQLCRVRGAKAIVRLMPHEAAELEPVIHALQAQDTDDYSTWETRYGLLLWLSMLSLVPFDIETIDSGLSGAVAGAGTEGDANGVKGVAAPVAEFGERQADLVGTILALGMKHLGDAGPTRDAAAACLSSLLTRPDMEASHLRRFLEWSASVLERVTAEGRAGQVGLNKLAFLVMGVMATLAALFKQGHREKLIDLIPVVFYPVVGLAELGPGQTLLRKMLVKLLQRVGTTFVPPRVVTWRYRRGQRSLLQNLASTPDEDTADASSQPEGNISAPGDKQGAPEERKGREEKEGMKTPDGGEAKGGEPQQQEEGETGVADEVDGEGVASEAGGRAEQDGGKAEVGAAEQEEEDDVDVPEELEDIVEALLCGLRDRDTVVRWSAAKGIGRITERLPQDLADDVVCGVLDLFVEAEWDGAWHGGCLALAELARRGLLLPERLPRACPLVRRALAYDVRRGVSGVGAHVRDAACYVCWAFARAYSPQVLGPHLPGLCDSMLSTALFDREVNVRRAAAAALQENVGRQGQSGGDHAEGEGAREGSWSESGGGVAHGIDVITAADYFSLGNRQSAYLEISKTIAAFDRYRRNIIDCLRLDKLKHWDPDLRRLSALALGGMAPLEPAYMAEVVLPAALGDALSSDLLRRHGACLALAEVTLALGKVSYALPTETVTGLLGVVPALEKARLYRGRGGELMRQAACRVVECLALTKPDVVIKTQLRLLDSIHESLRHAVESVQISATAALKAVLKHWFPVGQDGPSERLRARTIGLYVTGLRTEENAAVTRGCAMALGVLPRKLAGASRDVLEEVLDALKDAALGRHGPRSPSLAAAADGQEGTVPPDDDAPDAETRRNALGSLVSLCEEVGVGGGGSAEVDAKSGGGDGRDGPTGWRSVRLTVGDVEGVLATLLAAAEDYSVDKRGDVGSWCRVEALAGMERLLRLTARASRGFPLANREQSDSSEQQPGRAAANARTIGRTPASIFSQAAERPENAQATEDMYLTPSMVERVVCAVLKQLSEKLDSVRERAGTVLQKLVLSNDGAIPFVPEIAAVKHAIGHGASGSVGGEVGGATATVGEVAVNWASPGETFPIVVGLLAVPEYHNSIVAGLVVSVGGLSESVVTQSSKALLRWLRACKSARNLRAVAGLALRLVGMFGDAKGDPRIVVPLLKTLELLLSNDCFGSLPAEEHPFAELLLTAVASEMKGCRDVRKMCLGASVFVCMLDFSDPARARALRNSVLFLGHRFPNVRKTTAEALYLKLLANEEIVEEAVYDEALDILTCTAWDGDLQEAKSARSGLAKLLGVNNVPAPKKAAGSSGGGETDAAAPGGGGKPRKADELESYESLVRTMGY